MEIDWLNFLGSIIGGLIGGLFTYLGVRITIKNDNKNLEKAKREERYYKRPRLEILSHDVFEKKEKSNVKDSINVLVLKIKHVDGKPDFYYDDNWKNDEELCFVEYEFKNTGLTEIETIFISTRLIKETSLFNLETASLLINGHCLNYDDKYPQVNVKPNQTIKIRFFYLKDSIIGSNFGLDTIDLWLKDINDKLWVQGLDVTNKNIKNSVPTTFKKFHECTDVVRAEECFVKPHLW